MPTDNPFPLSIGTKQDSWERTQLLAAVPGANNALASEFNKIIQALNFLYERFSAQNILVASINNSSFNYIKHPDNISAQNAEVFEPYDYGFNYKRNDNIIWTEFQWMGGDTSDDANFIVHRYLRIEPIPE